MVRHKFSQNQQPLHFKICLFLIALIPFMSATSKASSNQEEALIENSEKKSPVVIRFSLTKSRSNANQNKTLSSTRKSKNPHNSLTPHISTEKYGGLTPNRPRRSMQAPRKSVYDNTPSTTDLSKTDDEKKRTQSTMTRSYLETFPTSSKQTSIDIDNRVPPTTLGLILELDEENDEVE